MDKPIYFDSIKNKSTKLWKTLEDEPKLRGPWDNTFEQVKNPRFVISELLQNADDAGANEAIVRLENHTFIFEHNGDDFNEENFQSLCDFCDSNKKNLHTIGFRGQGFKSTFSLGDCVKLNTPTLSICFQSNRFTEPIWLPCERKSPNNNTKITVKVFSRKFEDAISDSMREWLKNPLSLLFFNNIRSLKINNEELRWKIHSNGPINGSEWMVMNGDTTTPYLLVKSRKEEFPEDAIQEIKEVRSSDKETTYPPCSVEIVLGSNEGNLFAILPTGVRTSLPFCINAPFIQDPSRKDIRDPKTSPTNRWLLKRAGKLATSAMIGWLGNTEKNLQERARAYDFLPKKVEITQLSLEDNCSRTVVKVFRKKLRKQNCLLTETGNLASKKNCIYIPQRILEIWPAEEAASILQKEQSVLSKFVEKGNRIKLIEWGMAEETTKEDLKNNLVSRSPPCPKSWDKLLNLWDYLASESYRIASYNIVPVYRQEVLFSSNDVVRWDPEISLDSERDSNFFTEHLNFLDKGWLSFLDEKTKAQTTEVIKPKDVLDRLGLSHQSPKDKVIKKATENLSKTEPSLDVYIQFTQIIAKLGAKVGDDFHYWVADGTLKSVTEGILIDINGNLKEILPKEIYQTRVLHPEYSSEFVSCTKQDWEEWVVSGKSKLLNMVPFVNTESSLCGTKEGLVDELNVRDYSGSLTEPRKNYKNPEFYIFDWDFEKDLWTYWKEKSKTNPQIWGDIVNTFFHQGIHNWQNVKSAMVRYRSNYKTYYRDGKSTYPKGIEVSEKFIPKWVMKLREIPCLKDTNGEYKKPQELLRRTKETEKFLSSESFICNSLDNEKNTEFFDRLGVCKTIDSRRFINLIVYEKNRRQNFSEDRIDELYRGLDKILFETPGTINEVAEKFGSQNLILSQNKKWVAPKDVYLVPYEEALPNAELIRPEVRSLKLWESVGILRKPTPESALNWLNHLPKNEVLNVEEIHRLKTLLENKPDLYWYETKHWLNLQNKWVPIENLLYSLKKSFSVCLDNLSPEIKEKIADLRMLPIETTEKVPFSNINALEKHFQNKISKIDPTNNKEDKKEWLEEFGSNLCRINDQVENSQILREIGYDLLLTTWVATNNIQITPYLDDTSCGISREVEVFYQDKKIYHREIPKGKLVKLVPMELIKEIPSQAMAEEIKHALFYCTDRSPDDIRYYMQENFHLEQQSIENDTGENCPSETEESLGYEYEQDGFPELKVGDKERRKDGVLKSYSEAIEKNYEEVTRKVRTTKPAYEPKIYLKECYTNTDSQSMYCQICKKEMPFKKKDNSYYFEAKEVFDNKFLPREHHAQHLALCSNCSSMYQEFIKSNSVAMSKLRDEIISKETNEFSLSLGEEESSIRFVERHLFDLKTILEVEQNKQFQTSLPKNKF